LGRQAEEIKRAKDEIEVLKNEFDSRKGDGEKGNAPLPSSSAGI
jgi:hypothetical protein